MKRPHNLFLLTIMCLLLSTSYSNANLRDLFATYSKSKVDHANQAEVQSWVDRFEDALEQNPNDSGADVVKIKLADLYFLQSNFESGSALLIELRDGAQNSPDIRLDAARSLMGLYQRTMNLNVSIYESAFDRFEAIISQFDANGVQYNPSARFDLETINRKKAECYFALAKQTADAESKEKYFLEVIKNYQALFNKLHADEFSSNIQERLKNSWCDEAHTLVNLADAKFAYSEHLIQIQQYEKAKSQRSGVVSLLQNFFEQYPGTPPSQRAACIIINSSIHDLNYQETENLLNKIGPKIVKGHMFLNFLWSLGMHLSVDNEKLATANLIFEHIIKLNKNWFPTEFEQHTTYIWALLQRSQNFITMGDLAAAKNSIDILSNLSLKSEDQIEKFDFLRKYYGEYFESMVLTDINIDSIKIQPAISDAPISPQIDKATGKEPASPISTAKTVEPSKAQSSTTYWMIIVAIFAAMLLASLVFLAKAKKGSQ